MRPDGIELTVLTAADSATRHWRVLRGGDDDIAECSGSSCIVARDRGLTTQVMTVGGMPTSELGGADGVGFETAGASWIGRLTEDSDAISVPFDGPVETFEDIGALAAERLLRIGSTGLGDDDHIAAQILSIMPFDTPDQAVAMANASPYGLAAGLFTSDLHRALGMARQLRFGGVHVNEASSARVDAMPFGGVKDSGHGFEGPAYAVRAMTEERLITISY